MTTKPPQSKTGSGKKRITFKQRFADPREILNFMAEYMREGDIASVTDLISAYVANSPRYQNQEQFAEAIGTTRQTLHRMLSHSESVSMKVFFRAVERIYEDSLEGC